VRILLTGWFSFDLAEVTAGDLLARDTAVRWLTEAGLPHDVAVAENFRRDGDVALDGIDPGRYTDVVFVCGPASGEPVAEMFGRFPDARHLAVDVSVVDGTDRLPLDAVVARDDGTGRDGGAGGDGRAGTGGSVWRPDLSLARPGGPDTAGSPADAAGPGAAGAIPVVGVVMAHDQPEYSDRHRLADAHAVLGQALGLLDVARAQLETRLHPCAPDLCRTPAQVESAFARCDAIATTRMHGLVLALKAGVPAVGVDPVLGGGKVSAQAEALGWPGIARVGETSPEELAGLLRWSLSAEARTMTRDAVTRAQPALDETRARFLGLFVREQ
jgi:hypothetical protein